MIVYKISKHEYLVYNCGTLYCGVIGQTNPVYGHSCVDDSLLQTKPSGFPISIDAALSEYEEQNL